MLSTSVNYLKTRYILNIKSHMETEPVLKLNHLGYDDFFLFQIFVCAVAVECFIRSIMTLYLYLCL